MKVGVCYPGDTPFAHMAAVHSMLNIEIPPDCEVQWFRGLGWCQARRRIHAAEQALEWGADLIATLDVDQVYEPDVLCRLVGRIHEGYGCVAAMVPRRGFRDDLGMAPFQRLAWDFDKEGKKFVPVNPEDGEMLPVWSPTSACAIFWAKDLKRLEKPWYFYQFDPETWRETQGEDARFFTRMKAELTVQPWVDTTIKVKHCHAFNIDETFPDRFRDWADPNRGDRDICLYTREGMIGGKDAHHHA